MILFFKICLKSKQIKRGRLLVMILITLLCFLILTLPLYIYVFTTHFLNKRYLFDILELNFYLNPSASLNSSVNPMIYFLVGRKKRSWTRESIKKRLLEHYKNLFMNFSLAGTNATADNLDYTTTKVSYEYQIMSDYAQISMFPFIFILCCVGVTLNGIVIWLLGFQIKRNPFTVLILNLAIADFGFLISMAIFCIEIFIHFIPPGIPFQVLFSLFNFTYINGLFLLTAISIDRCVVVLFPIWHRCSRPKYLSLLSVSSSGSSLSS
ncbi:hypothetical protein E2320_011736 [Naja naja]|nr:hypothetical protein E2320_011736 [Naja naja]